MEEQSHLKLQIFKGTISKSFVTKSAAEIINISHGINL